MLPVIIGSAAKSSPVSALRTHGERVVGFARRSSSRRRRCQLLGRRWFEGNLVIVLFIGY